MSVGVFDNIVDTFTLAGTFKDQDDAIYYLQELRRLLEKAVSYWVADWQNEPVWLEFRGSNETNTRYAIIKGYQSTEDPNPFSQPMFSCPSSIDDFTLVIEHSLWSAQEPGSPECALIRDGGLLCSGLEFNGTTTYVMVVADATINNAHYSTFEVAMWFRAYDWGEGDAGVLIDKYTAGSPGNGWYLGLDESESGIYMRVECATSPAEAAIQFHPDGEWHFVAAMYDGGAGSKTPRLWLDGEEGTYLKQISGVGAEQDDSGTNLYIGNEGAAHAATFDGTIGWIRLGAGGVVTGGASSFTVPARCYGYSVRYALPKAFWLMNDGYDNTTVKDWGGNANDGTITDPAGVTWSIPYSCGGPRTAKCLGVSEYVGNTPDHEVTVSNHFSAHPLQFIYIYDQSLGNWYGNYINDIDYELFPVAFANSDAIFFGNSESPFWNLIFSTNVVAGHTLTYYYWNGAGWTAFTADEYRDMTNDLHTGGINSISWLQKNVVNWVGTGNLNTIYGGSAPDETAWWIKIEITGIGYFNPEQQDVPVYSACWNTIRIDDSVIKGDVPAHLNLSLEVQSWFVDDAPEEDEEYNVSRILIGARSVSRGSNFSSIIPLDSTEHVRGVTVVTYGGGIGSTIYSSCGKGAPKTSATDEKVFGIQFDSVDPNHEDYSASREYQGTYRIFVRYARISGAATNLKMRYVLSTYGVVSGELVEEIRGDKWAYLESDRLYGALADLGTVTWPPRAESYFGSTDPRDKFGGYAQESCLDFEVFDVAASTQVYYYDVILIPVDEWSADIYAYSTGIGKGYIASGPVEIPSLVQLDSLYNPKKILRAFERRAGSSDEYSVIGAHYNVITSDRMKVSPNSDQLLHLLIGSYNIGYPDVWHSCPGMVLKARLLKGERYLSMRGNR